MTTKWIRRVAVLLAAGSLSVGTFAFAEGGNNWRRDDGHRYANEWREHGDHDRDWRHDRDRRDEHRDYRNLRNDERRGDWRAAQRDRHDLNQDRGYYGWR